MNGIDGKVALVTGAASGIGRASALRFAAEGANVVVVDLDKEGGQEVVAQIEEENGDALFVEADVTDPSAVENMVETTIDTYGRFDFAHNNAGFSVESQRLTDTQEDYWDAVLDVYLKGVWLGMKYEIPAMLETSGGAIINTASVAGLEGEAGISHYSAAKHGVIGLTRTAAREFAEDDIRVNAVCPGPIETAALKQYYDANPELKAEQLADIPMNRFGDPTEIAAATVWLCSEDASFVTGHALPVDGGIRA